MGLLAGGVAALVAIVVIVVLVTSSSSGILPTGNGDGGLSWTGGTNGSGNHPVNVTGDIQNIPITARAVPTGRFVSAFGDAVVGTLSGSFGSDSFSVRVTGHSLSGTFDGQPISGSVVRTTVGLQFHGTIEGQPVTGVLQAGPAETRSIGNDSPPPTHFTFSGKIGNLTITGSAVYHPRTSSLTTNQHVTQSSSS